MGILTRLFFVKGQSICNSLFFFPINLPASRWCFLIQIVSLWVIHRCLLEYLHRWEVGQRRHGLKARILKQNYTWVAFAELLRMHVRLHTKVTMWLLSRTCCAKLIDQAISYSGLFEHRFCNRIISVMFILYLTYNWSYRYHNFSKNLS